MRPKRFQFGFNSTAITMCIRIKNSIVKRNHQVEIYLISNNTSSQVARRTPPVSRRSTTVINISMSDKSMTQIIIQFQFQSLTWYLPTENVNLIRISVYLYWLYGTWGSHHFLMNFNPDEKYVYRLYYNYERRMGPFIRLTVVVIKRYIQTHPGTHLTWHKNLQKQWRRRWNGAEE